MKHAFLVTPQALHHFADVGEDVRGSVPELLFRLLATSVNDSTERRIPFGRDVNQSGVDGFLETAAGFKEFVPTGKSFWEIGTGKNPRAKANSDYRVRTESKDVTDKQSVTLVLVTPRTQAEGWTQTEQNTWVEAKRREGLWKDIRVIDGTMLCHWLAFHPSIDSWLAERMRITRGAVISPAAHWDDISSRGDKPLTPQVFLSGRDHAKKEVLRVLRGELRELRLQTLVPREVVDFVVAVLASLDEPESAALSGRCLLIESGDVWKDLCELPDSHVLIPHGGLDIADQGADLLALALRKGHRVVLPTPRLTPRDVGAIPLKSPKVFELTTALRGAGFAEPRARQLAEKSAGSPSRLLRVLGGLPETPQWATGDNATLLAPAILAGSWDGRSTDDIRVLTKLFDQDYAEWTKKAIALCIVRDPPLQNRDTLWRFSSAFEAWHLLGPLVLPASLGRFADVALEVLGESNPALELSPEERWAASIHGKQPKFSPHLRQGLAGTLALLGTYPDVFTATAPGFATGMAEHIVRKLLHDADWMRWASLNDILPLLAEASPISFLRAVDDALQKSPSPFGVLFEQEGSGVTGGNYLTGLWWALESLAWSSDLLSEVALILCQCAAIDPGGNWTNRPANSLVDIFLPWHPQTYASIARRTEVVATMTTLHPDIGWKLVLALLPQSHASTSGTYKPQWREFIDSEWDDGVTESDYWKQVEAYTDVAIAMAKGDQKRLCELIERLPDLIPSSRHTILTYLQSPAIRESDDTVRLPLWDALMDLANKHRKFHDAEWAMASEEVTEVEATATAIQPQTVFTRHQRLFAERDFDLYDEKGNYEQQRGRLEETRASAIGDLLADGGLEQVLRFAQIVPSPWNVGRSLAQHGSSELDTRIIPGLFSQDRSPSDLVARSYILGRFFQERFAWVDRIAMKDWTTQQKAMFFSLLPFCRDTWQRAQDALKGDVGNYWAVANANFFDPKEGLFEGVENLLKHNRPAAALACLEGVLHDKSSIPPSLLLQTLEALLTTTEPAGSTDAHNIAEAFNALQKNSETDREVLMKMESAYLSLLGRFSGAKPKTLERRLADDPSFFCDVIRGTYPPKNGAPPEELSEPDKRIAEFGFKLLYRWTTLPGSREDGTIDGRALANWLAHATQSTTKSGHLDVALNWIGKVFAYHGADPDGLWLPRPVATALDDSGNDLMREGFTTEKSNQRGVHTWTAGKEEREIAGIYEAQAIAAEQAGYRRLGRAMHDLAERYEDEAQREAARDPYDDWS